MCPERGEGTHVLLGVMERVESLKSQVPVVRDVGSPVHHVDPDQDDADDGDPRHQRQAAQDQKSRMALYLCREAGLDQSEKRQDHEGEEDEVSRDPGGCYDDPSLSIRRGSQYPDTG
jgi:hypothetical protein